MDKYFLITENPDNRIYPIKLDVLATKSLCEITIANREKEGYKLAKVIKGRELKVRSKKVVVEYEIDETIYLGITARQLYND